MEQKSFTYLFLLFFYGCITDSPKLDKEIALPVTMLDSPLPYPPALAGTIAHRGFECGTTKLLREQLAQYDTLSKGEHFPTFVVPNLKMGKMIMTSSAQISPADSLIIHGVA